MTTSNATVPVPAGEDAEPSLPAKRKGALPTVSGSGPQRVERFPCGGHRPGMRRLRPSRR